MEHLKGMNRFAHRRVQESDGIEKQRKSSASFSGDPTSNAPSRDFPS